jgi:transcriptional regulator with XRE-family HTH domain
MDVGRALREVRESAGMSQARLAERVGVDPSTVSRCETGAKKPSLTLLERVLEVCGKDLELTVIERHVDVDRVLGERARLPLGRRIPSIAAWHLSLFARLSGPVWVGGVWAAGLHGLPCREADAVLLVPDEDQVLDELAEILLRAFAQMQLGRDVEAVRPRAALLREQPTSRWWIAGAGTFQVQLMAAGRQPPPGVPVRPPDGGLLRVAEAGALTREDGVAQDVLDRWRDWRRERHVPELTDVPWSVPKDSRDEP